MSNNNLIIRSSSAEFLIFDRQIHKKGIEVRFEDGDLWLTQKAISELYNIDRTVVTKHLKNIFDDYELDKMQYVHKLHILQKTAKNIRQIIII